MPEGEPAKYKNAWPPLAWWVAFFGALALCLFHVFGLHAGHGPSFSEFRAAYRNSPTSASQPFFRGVGCAVSLLPATMLILPWAFQVNNLVLPISWIVAILIVCCSLCYFAFLHESEEDERPSLIFEQSFRYFAVAARRKKREAFLWAVCCWLLASATSACWLLSVSRKPAEFYPLQYRMMHLNDGVSPLVPALLLVLAVFLFIWQLMAGNLILGRGRPLLPFCEAEAHLSRPAPSQGAIGQPPRLEPFRGRLLSLLKRVYVLR